MDIQNIPFQGHREQWLSRNFLAEYFEIKDRSKVFKHPLVSNLQHQLRGIPEQETYTLIGYGSLMNKRDVPRTLSTGKDHRLGFLAGYERIFNIGTDTAYLNVKENAGSEIGVALIDFKFTDLLSLIRREGFYNFRMVEVYDTVSEESINAIMVIGDHFFENNLIEPQLNYLHLCLTGAKELNELHGINNFLDDTRCYSPYHGGLVSIRGYLSKLNLVNYMIQNNYSSR